MKTEAVIALSGLLGLCACDGPWNMSVDDHSADRSLWVSSMQVAGKSYDTVWIEGVNPLSTAHDPSETVVDGGTMWITATSTAGTDSIAYRMSSTLPAAWIPQDTAKTVPYNAKLALHADVIQNDETKAISAQSYTPSAYRLDSLIGVPLETLHPHLADGSWRDSITAAVSANDEASLAVFVSRISAANSWAAVTTADLRAYAAKQAVMYNYPGCRAASTAKYQLWSIDDRTLVSPHPSAASQSPINAYARTWTLRQPVRDPSGYGGTVMIQRFDRNREYILTPLYQDITSDFGGTIDTAGYFQRGDTRLLQVAARYSSSATGWPDSIMISGFVWAHTGLNRILSYSVDSLYIEFYRSLQSSGDGQAYHYYNVNGARGYFAGAAMDSIGFDLESATNDTFAIAHMQKLWCDTVAAQRKRGESTAIPLTQLQKYCPEYF